MDRRSVGVAPKIAASPRSAGDLAVTIAAHRDPAQPIASSNSRPAGAKNSVHFPDRFQRPWFHFSATALSSESFLHRLAAHKSESAAYCPSAIAVSVAGAAAHRPPNSDFSLFFSRVCPWQSSSRSLSRCLRRQTHVNDPGSFRERSVGRV